MSQPPTAAEIRRRFLEYFASRGHRTVPSSSVIPHGDRTLLFTNAGMNQFKDVFLGREKREYTRAASSQKCIRAGGKHNDLDNVGYTARHLTFFEMLGNFSFGDYFKKDAIEYGWGLLTGAPSSGVPSPVVPTPGGFGLDPARLWITVYKDDDEARAIWRDKIGVKPERILGLGEKDNYWSMGDVGPCGPCSEIHVDRGAKYACGPNCGIGRCDCDRFFEIWNLVFMQFDQTPDGKKPLPRPSIDTGMGLERIAMVLQGVESVYETDLLRGIIRRVEELTGVAYDPGPAGVPHRVLADHIRSLVFAFSDGAEPSNEGRGYVLRRILRRAARYGRKLKAAGQLLLTPLAGAVVAAMGDDFPELKSRAPYVSALIAAEEERFDRTLDEGIERFDRVVEHLKKRGEKSIPGAEVFFLYDTCGFPVDLVGRMAEEIGFAVDTAGYESEMERQRERSRAGQKFKAASAGRLDLLEYPETRFVGYELTRSDAEVLGAVRQGEDWDLILSATPFYGESGGQVGDTGLIRGDDFVLRVEDTQKEGGRFLHRAKLVEGDPERIRSGALVSAEIDSARRDAIERNHTATHLLQAALRKVVGEHVHQKGSLVSDARLRFDVTHFKGVAPDEIERVEEMVLGAVTRDHAVETFETSYADALKLGAMALFGEKYGDRVRVVKIGDFSIELCGGTHVARTGEIGDFSVAAEGSVSAGVRRIEALTAAASLRRHQQNARTLAELSAKLKVPADQLAERIEKLLAAASAAAKPPKAAAAGAVSGGAGLSGLSVETWKGRDGDVQVLSGAIQGVSGDDLLAAFDGHKAKSPRTAALLLGTAEGKVQVLVAMTPALTKAGGDSRAVFQAGSEAISGRGGGRPEMVRGSGTQAGGVQKAIEEMKAKLKEQVG